MPTAKYWVITSVFNGAPKDSDFELREEELPSVGDGEFRCEAVCWSVDPYMRAYIREGTKLPYRMFGYQVAKVVESKNPRFKEGSHVVGHLGWRTATVCNDKGCVGFEANMDSPPYLVSPMLKDLPLTYMVGVLGMPGMTAYFGVRETLKPKAGEVLLVNGAAGAVGSFVGQLGKIYGCKVIGYAGTDAKVEWLKNLGFDAAFNYKTDDLDASIKTAAPDGIDCFFDNVGGDFASTVYKHLRLDSRICQCGAISTYNRTGPAVVEDFRMSFIFKRTVLSGFHVAKYGAQFPVGIKEMATYIAQGKLKTEETKWAGFEKMPTAFMAMLTGANTGKAVVTA